ncbi:hypothetical protein H9P43_004553 [Blastocladiella emersonii ATCC 22665]|nr:hypothetical protein H9P43_004553 [Blastocladiella emersonii ATCC 22665]
MHACADLPRNAQRLAWTIIDALVNLAISLTFVMFLRELTVAPAGGMTMREDMVGLIRHIQIMLLAEAFLIMAISIARLVDPMFDPSYLSIFFADAVRLRIFSSFLDGLSRVMKKKSASKSMRVTSSSTSASTSRVSKDQESASPSKSMLIRSWLRYHPRSITLFATATVFADMFVYTAVIPILPEIAINKLGSTPSQVGLLVSMLAIAQLITTPIFGWASDKFGSRKYRVVISLAILAGTSALYVVVTEYWHFLVVRAIQGVATAGNLTLSFALVGDVYPTSKLGVATGIALAGMNAGGMVGPAIGGLLYGEVGPSSPFWAAMVLTAACFAYRLFVDDEPARAYKRAQLEAQNGTAGTSHASILTLMRARSVWLNAFVVFVVGLLIAGLQPILPPYLTAQYGTSVSVNGTVFLALAVPGIVFGPFVVLGAAFTVALSPPLTSMGAYIDAHHRDSAGQVYSIFHMSFATSLSLGPIAAGAMYENFGMLACTGLFAGLSLVIAAVYAVLDRGATTTSHQVVGDEESDEAKPAAVEMTFEQFLHSRVNQE